MEFSGQLRSVLRGKIQRATVTGTNLDYDGSITLDPELMDAAGIAEWEHVHVLDVSNGARLETYAVGGTRGTGEVAINGAAAHLIHTGDLIIVLVFQLLPEEVVAMHQARVVRVDAANSIKTDH